MEVNLPLADELVAGFARASELLFTDETVERALQLITAAAHAAIPGAAGAGVTLIDRDGRKRTAAVSDDSVAKADSRQYELGEGPCITAWATGEAVLVADIRSDPRWPQWSQAGQELGFLSSVGTPLLAGGTALGAVKVYSRQADAFSDASVRLMELFAAQATIFISNAQARESARQLSGTLREALSNREVIAAGRGVLMERHGIDEETAMQQLMAESRRARKPLREVSAAIVDSALRTGG